MTVLQWLLWMLGLGLQGLLLIALSHGVGKRFPALFAYVGCLLATTITDIVASELLGQNSTQYVTYYWSAELIRQSALFAVVVSLAFHVLPSGAKGQAYRRVFTVAAIFVWAGSVVANHDATINSWMTTVVRNLSFFTGMITLCAWFAYARLQGQDLTRLMIVAGLGLQMTGEATGQAIRLLKLFENSNFVGGMVVVLTHMLGLFIWWRALRIADPYSEDDQPELGLGDLESRHSASG